MLAQVKFSTSGHAYAQALNNKMHVLVALGKQKEAMQKFKKI